MRRECSVSGVPVPVAPSVVLVPTARFACLERRALGAAVTWDEIAPGIEICQLKNGHRFSNDDRLCAYFGTEVAPRAARLLDLGAGVGSVGLSALARCGPDATLVCVEAQTVSHELCARTVRNNADLAERVTLVRGDLRDFRGGGAKYDLVTASPPYWDPLNAVPSAHDQKACCRLEYRGGLDEYCACAARCLAPGGTFAFVMVAGDPRNDAAPAAAGFSVARRVDVVFKAGRPPQIVIIVCCWAGDPRAEAPRREVLTLRDERGERTRAYRAWQEAVRLPRTVSPAAVDAALTGLVAATAAGDRGALAAAVGSARALGLRPTPGSHELSAAEARLAALGGKPPD